MHSWGNWGNLQNSTHRKGSRVNRIHLRTVGVEVGLHVYSALLSRRTVPDVVLSVYYLRTDDFAICAHTLCCYVRAHCLLLCVIIRLAHSPWACRLATLCAHVLCAAHSLCVNFSAGTPWGRSLRTFSGHIPCTHSLRSMLGNTACTQSLRAFAARTMQCLSPHVFFVCPPWGRSLRTFLGELPCVNSLRTFHTYAA